MQIHRRNELPALLIHLDLLGTGIELGVARATFSHHILANCAIRRLYSVDAWAGDRGHDITQCDVSPRRLSRFGARSIVLRAKFEEALSLFDDASLDFVYIDGYAHTGNAEGQTLSDWWPKVKPGGIFAGHDYSPKWAKNIVAVDAFR